LSDARVENYDFSAPLPREVPAAVPTSSPASASTALPPQHAQKTHELGTPVAGDPGTRAGKLAPTKRKSAEEIPAASLVSSEHLVIVRVWDRFHNVGTAKTIVRPRAAGAERARSEDAR
jgi:hypothetical protein